MLRTAFAFAAFACANGAFAQATNCVSIGGGMTHCDTMPDMSHPHNGGGNTLGVIADAIARSNERSFQKKVGALLAAGDCAGAAKLALSKGRLDLGNQISAVCSQRQAAINPRTSNADPSVPTSTGPSSSPLTATIPELENRLQVAAAKANAATPTPLNEITTATKVEAIGTQILITAKVADSTSGINDSDRSSITNQICANMAAPDLLRAGASIRIKYFNQNGQDIGSVMVTRVECGV